MDKLLIIESPNKIKTLTKYLGKDYEIIATIGHIRDLNQFGMGFDADFEPKWVIPSVKKNSKNKNEVSKKEIVEKLKKSASKAKEIYIATDPDREGEAIAWHVYEVLDAASQKKCKRITFNEITKNAILESLNHKRDIDINWVQSQFARRIIDRLIGFKLSKLLQTKLKADSAGRVQSVALKFIEDREKEIRNFVAENWWTLDVMLEDNNSLILKSIDPNLKNIKLSEKKFSTSGLDIADEESANNLLNALDKKFKVKSIEEPSFYSSYPKSPYKTSTLQQDAINKLGWNSKKITLIAQHLYEGVEVDGNQIALISYPRTDSLRLSDTFVQSAFKFIEETYGKDYVGKYQVKSSANDANTQDAHEAIRPIDPYLTPQELKNKISKDEFALYQLIYNRTVASLMAAAKFKKVTIKFDNNNCEFYTFSRECLFLGFKKLYVEDNEDEENKLIDLNNYPVGKEFKSKVMEVKKHETQPPQRYTQATLIGDLESAGVGRPSTYSSMANIALERGYAVTDKKAYVMTDIGKIVVDQLEKFFPDIINKDFTKKMEEHLDQIASGNEEWKSWLKKFAPGFDEEVKKAYDTMEKISDEKVGRECPKCGKDLLYKRARRGGSKFIGCSGYPECTHLEPLEKPEELEISCPECGSKLLKRKSKRQQVFVGCSSWPKCNYIISDKLFDKHMKETPDKPLPSKKELEEIRAARLPKWKKN
ncbi:DNA topoisomerase I [Malacoplasma penetrans HF-2]|uniref:DNA topoisomerase 1 n=1 Tax=Malacoplasma penetrans (strain HF-2) TaxID=272633 RepID=Q8EVZ3_MALP2|nr:type I DNA topoisomerase [Malacoplasma penetrans]BAC44204.1 DNA topoisomerase I [Malacoplasma penetrans HF-2]